MRSDTDLRRSPTRVGRGLAWLLSLVAASSAAAQTLPPAGVSLNDLVIEWMSGNYATPLLCTLDREPKRGLRRILISPVRRRTQYREALVQFADLEAGGAVRCFSEIGGHAPNIVGDLTVRHRTTKTRDTAMRDFKAELKRKRGFELDIVSGRLEMTEVGGAGPAETLDLRGGKLRIHILRNGSDAMRLLQDLPSPRKVMIEIESKQGRRLAFPASLARPTKGPRRTPGRG